MSEFLENEGFLQLEETLQILEESLQHDVFSTHTATQHIKRLKQLYSPRFDFEHSESGSYSYAALRCVSACYLDEDAKYDIPLSSVFKESLELLMQINMLALGANKNKAGLTESLLAISNLWNLNDTLDIPELLLKVLINMRSNLLETSNAHFKAI